MSNLEHRMRQIMDRESLTYQEVSEYAEVSTQAVYKWLFKGDISDRKARELSQKIGFDWLWLKYGIHRVPLDTFYDMVMASTNNMLLVCWTDFRVIAASNDDQGMFDYIREDLVGRDFTEFLVDFDKDKARSIQKIIFALSGMVEHSFRCTIKDRYSVKAAKVNCKGITTDDEGHTYEISQVEIVKPNGTEGSLRSLRFHKKTAIDLNDYEIERLTSQYNNLPWLGEFLKG